jgi:hypothetical protein
MITRVVAPERRVRKMDVWCRCLEIVMVAVVGLIVVEYPKAGGEKVDDAENFVS